VRLERSALWWLIRAGCDRDAGTGNSGEPRHRSRAAPRCRDDEGDLAERGRADFAAWTRELLR
jgi:hypothetical protein